jgi:Mrp family chromosome partitioning ATPase
MGRMLDTLRQSPATSSPVSPTAPPNAAVEAQDASTGAEAMSFIEVGGPQKLIEASPDVLATPAPPRPAPAAAVAKAAAAPASRLDAAAATPEPGAWAVQFRPLNRERSVPGSPMRRIATELIAHHQPEHPAAQQYRNLLAGLLAHCPSGWGQVLLFTSPAPWGGTTTVLLNLAVTAARQEGRRVAVVDANFRRPALGERLGLGAAPGLREVLAGSVPLPQALQETGQNNLWALTSGQSVGGPEGRLPLDWLLPTLRQLRQQFSLVFVDAASWNEGSEVSALAATCDAVYMVMSQVPGAPAGDNALPPLRQPPSNLQGCILTVR